MNNMKSIKITQFSLIALLITVSCTKLDEKDVLYDTVISENFYKTDAELASAVGAAYSPLFGFGGNTAAWRRLG
jgi:hypothetical protein